MLSVAVPAGGNFECVSPAVGILVEVQMHGHAESMLSAKGLAPHRNMPSFLQAKQQPAQSNVRVVPTDVSYPSVASMVQAIGVAFVLLHVLVSVSCGCRFL